MERAPRPTSAPIAADQAAVHTIPVLAAEAAERDAGDPLAELRGLAAALRSHLGWLQTGGVVGLPRPAAAPSRPRSAHEAASAPRHPPADYAAPAPSPDRAAVAEQQLPPRHEMAQEPSATDAAAAARAALQASARAAAAPRPPTDPGRRPSPATAQPGAQLKPPLAEAHYPELDEPALLRAPAAAALLQIRQLVGDCRRCKLCHGRTNLVFGEGTPEPWVVFVGEGPGADEDRLGQPFVGAAGELLNRMIKAMADEAGKRGHGELREHLSRQQVYIANVVKCRPPGNRTPEADEIAACAPFLRAQLGSLRPRVIVALGRTPTHYLLQTTAPISRLRGQFAMWNGVPVMPTYHPAYVLRTEGANKLVWEDLKQVIERLSH